MITRRWRKVKKRSQQQPPRQHGANPWWTEVRGGGDDGQAHIWRAGPRKIAGLRASLCDRIVVGVAQLLPPQISYRCINCMEINQKDGIIENTTINLASIR